MNAFIHAAVESYRGRSLAPLKAKVPAEVFESMIALFVDIAMEVDDCEKPDKLCHELSSFSGAKEKPRRILLELLRALNKPLSGLAVTDVLEKWGVIARHENLAVWKARLQFRKKFGKDVEREAANLVKTVAEKSFEARHRRNLRNTVSFAIDSSGTQDVDDAIACDVATNTVFVHIAAPAEYVNNDKQHILMREASKRLLSIYSCQERLPMFPDEVATKLFSLKCNSYGSRYATTFKFRIAEDGSIVPASMQVCASIISRPVCLTYQMVSDILKNPAHSHYRALKYIQKLAELRKQWRFTTGGARQHQGKDKNFQHSAAHLIVDEMMISGNTVAAKLAMKSGIPVLYRGVSSGNCYATSGSRNNTYRGTRYTCSVYASGTKRRDMEKGANVQLHVRPVRHAGLGLDGYLPVTSPIRKFADLIAHCQFNAIIRNRPPPFTEKGLLEIKDEIMEVEKTAARIERRGKRYWAYHQLEKEGAKVHLGILKERVSDVRERNSGHRKPRGFRRTVLKGENATPWVVYLKDVRCDVNAIVPFWGRAGSEVKVQISKVNPRTSYILAHVLP